MSGVRQEATMSDSDNKEMGEVEEAGELTTTGRIMDSEYRVV